MSSGSKPVGSDDNDSIVQLRKRRRLLSDEGTPLPDDDDGVSLQSGALTYTNQEMRAPPSKKVVEFNEKLVEVFHSMLQSSSTPEHLQHRFLVGTSIVTTLNC